MKNALTAVAVVLVVALLGAGWVSYNDEDVRTTCVISTDRARQSGSSKSDARVYTDAGTFQVRDAKFTFWRTNSADVLGRIVPGKEYRITTVGWRQGFMDEFPNIKKAVPTGQSC